jgi:sortase (surface protein transpeptidase)
MTTRNYVLVSHKTITFDLNFRKLQQLSKKVEFD